jgi:hypothetical protein
MGNLFFPQLSSGAYAQYPIRKVNIGRTVKNVLPDGSLILFSDPYASRLQWQLSYMNLDDSDIAALQQHFALCSGPVHAFTFIDPTDNMLVWSMDPTQTAWQSSNTFTFSRNIADPVGGTAAFAVTNNSQIPQSLSQTLAVPSGYQYCFSIYARSSDPTTVAIVRSGAASQASDSFAVGPYWTRLVSSGRLNDSGTNFSVSVVINPAQQIQLYGPQLEPQITPSAYRATSTRGGVYANAHWAIDKLTVLAEAPHLFSTTIHIEAVLTI